MGRVGSGLVGWGDKGKEEKREGVSWGLRGGGGGEGGKKGEGGVMGEGRG